MVSLRSILSSIVIFGLPKRVHFGQIGQIRQIDLIEQIRKMSKTSFKNLSRIVEGSDEVKETVTEDIPVEVNVIPEDREKVKQSKNLSNLIDSLPPDEPQVILPPDPPSETQAHGERQK